LESTATRGEAGSAVFTVLGDGKVLFRSPKLRGRDAAPTDVTVPVAGVDELTLKVDDGGDADLADVADWAVAQLLK